MQETPQDCLTIMSDEQSALLEKIKALSGAIDERRSGATSTNGGGGGGRGRGFGPGPSSYRGGVTNRGRRGAKQYGGPLPSRHRTLVLSGPQSSSASAHDSDPTLVGSGQVSGTAGRAPDGWVKRKSAHNVSLVSSSTFEKTEPARLAAIAASKSAKEEFKSNRSSHKGNTKAKSKSDASVRRGDAMGEVIIDGVTFEFDETGTKLVKKVPSDAGFTTERRGGETVLEQGSKDGESDGGTPLHTSVNGQKFIRTKTGNMISQALLDQRKENKRNSEKLKRLEQMGKEIAERQKARDAGRRAAKAASISSSLRKSKTLCAYFNKTGQCKNGLRCPYKHDPSRIAICPRFLRPSGCPLPDGTCPLSHKSTAERVPHCVHFLANAGQCRNGDACVYTHPTLTNLTIESPICMPFSDFGWCKKGQKCEERHTWDCPEFLRKGKCDRRGCKLMHVVRVPASSGASTGTRQLDDDELFLRDDDAYVHPEDQDTEEEDEEGGKDDEDQKGKRKRDGLGSGSEEEVGVSFKVQKSKEFSGQDDFISFDDLEDGADDEEEGEGASVSDDRGDSGDEATSVHSESDDEAQDG